MPRLRMEFDPGSGTCLWADDLEAREGLGSAVDHHRLPLSDNTRRWLDHLIAWFDVSIDWNSPTEPGPE